MFLIRLARGSAGSGAATDGAAASQVVVDDVFVLRSVTTERRSTGGWAASASCLASAISSSVDMVMTSPSSSVYWSLKLQVSPRMSLARFAMDA